jgi:hypothetical protein
LLALAEVSVQLEPLWRWWRDSLDTTFWPFNLVNPAIPHRSIQ